MTAARTGGTNPRESQEVAPIELFFDLVFVFAVSQLSHHLLGRLSWRGAAETAVLLAAVFGVWAYTSFETTAIGARRRDSLRALLVVMFLGLVMNAAIGHAFDDGAWAFVIPLLACQFGYGALTRRTTAVSRLREHYGRMLLWFVTTTPLWLVGACVGPHERLEWWAAAAVIDVVGTWLGHPLPGRVLRSDRLPFDAAHMLERLRLFLMIALGEAVLTTGTAIAAEPTRPETLLTGAGCLAAVVALWALYFGDAHRLVSVHLEQTTDPIRSAHLGINGQYVTLAGLITLAVGNELVIAHPGQGGSWRLGLLLFGGPLLYVGALTWYLVRTTGRAFAWRWIACAALVAGGLVARVVPGAASLVILLVVLGCLVTGVLRTAAQRARCIAH